MRPQRVSAQQSSYEMTQSQNYWLKLLARFSKMSSVLNVDDIVFPAETLPCPPACLLPARPNSHNYLYVQGFTKQADGGGRRCWTCQTIIARKGRRGDAMGTDQV